MKKFTLLSAVLVAGMATAQVQMTPENLEVRKATVQAVDYKSEITMEKFSVKQPAAAADYAAHDYYHADGQLHSGYTPQFYSLSMPLIMLPFTQEIVWENYYGPTNWYSQYDGKLLAENSETYTMKAWEDYALDGMYYLIYTGDHTLTQDGVDYKIKGYYYAESAGMGGAAFATGKTPVTISTGENIPMTLAGMETALMENEHGQDFYMVSYSATNCPYCHGTSLYIDTAYTVRVDTIGSVVRNPSPMKISAINIPIYNSSQKGITAMLPEGASVKVEIFAADLAQDTIYTDSLLAVSSFTAANYTDVYGYYGTVVVTFQEEDAFGSMMDVDVMVDGDFYVQLTNYNESGCDFGIFSDFYTPGGTTIFTVNGKQTTLFKDGGMNLGIGYNAYWPMTMCDTDSLVAPVEGGIAMDGEYAAFALYTNVYDVDNAWEVSDDETSEWLEFAVVETSTLEEGYVVAQITADALPEGVTGREGAVVVVTDGYKVSIPVVQGEIVETGVENVVTPSFNGKTFNLLGVEVDENYKGIVIKNGQKFIQ